MLQVVMRHSMDFDDSCYFIDRIDDYVNEFVQGMLLKDGFETTFEEEPSGEINHEDTKDESNE